MEVLRKIYTFENLKTVLNLTGTGLMGVGIFLLPFDLSYRLISLGVFTLALWYSLNK